MKVLLLTPPLLQPNTPYAATPLLAAFLRSCGHEATQADLSLELLLKLFSKSGIAQLCEELSASRMAEEASLFLEMENTYATLVEDAVSYLQGRHPAIESRFARLRTWPKGPYISHAMKMARTSGAQEAFSHPGEAARHYASLFLDDIAEAAKLLDPHFGFSRYAEQLAVSLPSFAPLKSKLERCGTLFIRWLEQLTDQQMAGQQPDWVAITIPFPGCLFGALAIARRIRKTHPSVRIVLGGGYVNTEWRNLREPALFDYADAICLDSGMFPLLRLIECEKPSALVRTYLREGREVRFHNDGDENIRHDALPAPTYQGLPLERYFGLDETRNPVMRLWSDGRWNKLALAQGCPWRRCAFCDTSIDYICRYDPAHPATVCDWMQSMMAETGFHGFHFVDEALAPDLVNALCDEMMKRKLHATWWGNIRFEKKFTGELIMKMKRAGCIAVTGGLETCCDRTLRLMRKGITMSDAKKVLEAFARSGIKTHAYLMYGFPTQTREETLQALDTARHLMAGNILHSAFWHRFALTAHSEMARQPERYGIRLLPAPAAAFAVNEIPFDGTFDHDVAALGEVLRVATYNFMRGVGLERPAVEWL